MVDASIWSSLVELSSFELLMQIQLLLFLSSRCNEDDTDI